LPSLDLSLDFAFGFEPLNREPPEDGRPEGRFDRGLLLSSAISCAPIRIQIRLSAIGNSL